MKRLLPVIFLAGCPDATDGAMTPPTTHDPGGPCVGFGVTFGGQAFSDASYVGLHDSWRGAYGDDPWPIATGGIEYVQVYGAWHDDKYVQQFEAAVNGPALAIDAPGPFNQAVPITGVSPGIADLCVYDPGSDTVRSGTRLVVRDVASMFVAPVTSYYASYESVVDTPYPFENWRMHTGPKRMLGAGLVSAEDWRLADSKMTIEVAVGDAPPAAATREAWDAVSLDVMQPTSVRLHVTLSSGEVHDASVEFTDRVDRLVRHVPSYYEDLSRLQVGGSWGWECFDAFVGDARVLGAPFTFSATPQVALTVPSSRNCVQLQPVAPGNGALTVQVDDQALELPFTVLPPTGS